MSEKTDELRRLLDERGIEWNYGLHGPSFSTEIGAGKNELTFIEVERGLLCSTYLRPEQIADIATGHGECRNVAPDYLDFLCSACGFVHYHNEENDDGDGNDWSYCPRCGRRVL